MVTKRDKLMLNYLQNFKCAHTSSLAMFYPNLRTAQRRLKILYECRSIGRCRDNINAEYIYYISKPKQLRHSVLMTDFLREFSKIASIKECRLEVSIGNIRSDALIGFIYKNKRQLAFIEIQISNTSLDVQKYEKLYYSGIWKDKLPEFPLIVAVTDRKIPDTELNVIQVNEDLNNIKL